MCLPLGRLRWMVLHTNLHTHRMSRRFVETQSLVKKLKSCSVGGPDEDWTKIKQQLFNRAKVSDSSRQDHTLMETLVEAHKTKQLQRLDLLRSFSNYLKSKNDLKSNPVLCAQYVSVASLIKDPFLTPELDDLVDYLIESKVQIKYPVFATALTSYAAISPDSCSKVLTYLKQVNCNPPQEVIKHALDHKCLTEVMHFFVATDVPLNDDTLKSWLSALIELSAPDKLVNDMLTHVKLFMKWREVNVMPDDVEPLKKGSDGPEDKETLNRLYSESGLDRFERDILKYRFRDKAYLVQALTHNSYFDNQVTDCYQRLDFLGDAVLNFLITRHLYEDKRKHSPGALTELKSSLVSNNIFANLAVQYEFNKYFKVSSQDLHRVITAFVERFNAASCSSTGSDCRLFLGEGECENAEDVEVPKALGDIFESVAGAIYLDSGMSLDAVWRVYYRMMKPEIDHYSKNVPKSHIQELVEREPQKVIFWKPELTPDLKVRVVVEVFGHGEFVGIGRNKRIAKCIAAREALRALNEKHREQ